MTLSNTGINANIRSASMWSTNPFPDFEIVIPRVRRSSGTVFSFDPDIAEPLFSGVTLSPASRGADPVGLLGAVLAREGGDAASRLRQAPASQPIPSAAARKTFPSFIVLTTAERADDESRRGHGDERAEEPEDDLHDA